jgi:hypothetical protein
MKETGNYNTSFINPERERASIKLSVPFIG